jgi:hypothetical protein
MSRKIADYLAELASDPKAREAHRQDPQEAMRKYSLNDEEREIIASEDHERIREAVRKSDPKLAETLAIILG